MTSKGLDGAAFSIHPTSEDLASESAWILQILTIWFDPRRNTDEDGKRIVEQTRLKIIEAITESICFL